MDTYIKSHFVSIKQKFQVSSLIIIKKSIKNFSFFHKKWTEFGWGQMSTKQLKMLFKFIYSEKTAKFCEIFTLLVSYVVPVKSKVKILQNFVAFSEYMNFKGVA